MLTLLATLAVACPVEPALRDPDGELTVLEQNLKFIITGTKRSERAEMLSHWLDGPGAPVDLLLLSEARLTTSLRDGLPGWCLYTQSGDGVRAPYAWRPVESGLPPGGLVVGVRNRPDGELRALGVDAGRRFRAAPATLSEGLLGRLFRYEKGWADLEVDGTHLVWSHTQASYRKHPEKGAGRPGAGRWGQFDDLAEDLGRPDHPTLLTGDLNLLDLFHPRDRTEEPDEQVAEIIDRETVTRFQDKTGLDFHWLHPQADRDQRNALDGTFIGSIFRHDSEPVWDTGARYDRVGVNDPFKSRHPGTRLHRVEIATADLRVSDHAGLLITIPFATPSALP